MIVVISIMPTLQGLHWHDLSYGKINGTIAQPIFTLPSGYRPKDIEIMASISASVFAEVRVNTSGAVYAVSGDNTWVCLDNLSFVPF